MSFPLNTGLKNFCFCMSLRTGSRVISSITMFICSLHLLRTWMKFTVYHAGGIYCKRGEDNDISKYVKFDDIHLHDDNSSGIHSLNCSNSIELFMLIFESLIYLLGFMSSILLMYAIKTKQPRLFLSWMMFSGMVLFSTFFYILFWRQPRYVVTNCLSFLIQFYFFGIVSSYHQQLVEEHLGGEPPVVAIALPRDSRLGVDGSRIDFEVTDMEPRYDPSKFDPPPPYPGPPTEFENYTDPPSYSLCNPHYACIPPDTEVSETPVIVIPLDTSNERAEIGPPASMPDHQDAGTNGNNQTNPSSSSVSIIIPRNITNE